ncbi:MULTISPECIES: hypothetical protein [Salinimonas]|uniref:Uncharacterized protein n=2 Tax=Salinimonas TaxID=288793 RepID=A0A5B7YLH2_9ALTE|nr:MULTISPECIES: hypothetical protein [Salinimonas]MBD3587519.1 hypothetical protein [Salinimonas profundi]QCZ95569.1 hypothetical protein FBQ74_18790 [Salinimonas iocasae]
MNLQHGFYSKSTSINPDARMIQAGALRSAELAMLVALMGSAIEEFQLDTGARLYAYVIENPEPISLSQMQYHMNSVMTKIKKLRVKF